MTAPHSAYEDLARERRGSEEYHQGYAEARQAFLIGSAIREQRLALGLSQAELAIRAHMTQPALSRLEAGGVVPTIRVLERISAALDADLVVRIAPHAAALPRAFAVLGSLHPSGSRVPPSTCRNPLVQDACTGGAGSARRSRTAEHSAFSRPYPAPCRDNRCARHITLRDQNRTRECTRSRRSVLQP